MKNPQITTKLRHMMADERKEKLSVIACIIDDYREIAPHLVNGDTFDALYELEMYELNDILSDLTSAMFCECLVSVGKI